ncbi:MAG: hypothetical protein LBC59_04155 [Chitinispirillales bacterium]|nr:hypothetical protein [Chitinispirillales bacterium]
MKRPTFFLVAAALFTVITAPPASAQIKYVAVVETEVDEASGVSAKLNKIGGRLQRTRVASPTSGIWTTTATCTETTAPTSA